MNWERRNIHSYWGRQAASKHVVQVYDNDELLLDSLEGFARSGLSSGDSVVVIARQLLLSSINTRLEFYGYDTGKLRFSSRLVFLDAAETLAQFMKGSNPDKELFNAHISKVFDHAADQGKRSVRAYGEMVSLLWQDNNRTATIELEELWNDFCSGHDLTLFCAYPAHIFDNPEEHLPPICNCHHHELNGSSSHRINVQYRSTAAHFGF
jgi:hypothetical protein